MSDAYKIIDHTYDTVVVGAGGSGLRATMSDVKFWFIAISKKWSVCKRNSR